MNFIPVKIEWSKNRQGEHNVSPSGADRVNKITKNEGNNVLFSLSTDLDRGSKTLQHTLSVNLTFSLDITNITGYRFVLTSHMES